MTAFLAAAHFDTFDLIASLRIKMGLFKRNNRIEVRAPKTEGDQERFVLRQHAARWPELTNLLQRIRRLGEQMGGIEFGRIDLEMLPAGACMDWRLDQGEETLRYEHAIMLLRTSPAVTFFAGSEVAAPGIGFLTIMSRRLPRSAINTGEAAAIWLALDFRRRQSEGA